MDHVVYLDRKARELENLKNGSKDMIIRGAMGRKIPYERVDPLDTLYFIENIGDGLVKAKATVAGAVHTDKLGKEESMDMVKSLNERLLLNDALMKRFGGKRYLVLIYLKDFEDIEPFRIDRSAYGNMDDWLPVHDIESVMIS